MCIQQIAFRCASLDLLGTYLYPTNRYIFFVSFHFFLFLLCMSTFANTEGALFRFSPSFLDLFGTYLNTFIFSVFMFFFLFSNVHAHLHKYRRFVVPFSFRSFSTNQAGIGTNNSCDAVVNRSSCSLRRCHHCIIEETTFAWAKMVVFFFRPIFVVDSCVHRCHSSSAPPSANHSEKIFLFLDDIFLVLK